MDSFRSAGGANCGLQPGEEAVAEVELRKIGQGPDQQGGRPESQGEESIPAGDENEKPFRFSQVNPPCGKECQNLRPFRDHGPAS
jgi:hypothetical protein